VEADLKRLNRDLASDPALAPNTRVYLEKNRLAG
jgi:hypothetical protein